MFDTRHIAAAKIAAAVSIAICANAATPATPQVQYPPEDTAALLTARKQKQAKTVDQFKVFYQFQFEDKLAQSDHDPT